MSSRVGALRQARADMIAVREQIYRSVEGRTDEALLRRPADGGWSAAEVLDHIRTAETLLVKGLRRVSRGDPVRIPRRAWFYRLPMAPVFWSIRVPAPKLVRPRPPVELKPADVVAGLRASRQDLFELADAMGEERFASLLFPHFLLGRFRGLDWFRFISRHEKKHAGQLDRTLATTAA